MPRIRLVVFLCVILAGRDASAQNFDFSAIPRIEIGVANQGAVGAIGGSGSLGAAVPTALAGFVAADVAVSGSLAFAVGRDATRQPRLIVLAAAGDGTFALPQSVRLAGLPTSIAVFDIDLDGLDDVVVTEESPAAGALEVFTGRFLRLGEVSLFDRSDLAVVRLGGDPSRPGDPATVSNGKIQTVESAPISVTVNRLDGDAWGDVAYVTSTGVVSVVYGTALGFAVPRPVGSVQLSKPGAATPRLIASGVLNTGTLDSAVDLVVATAFGAVILVNSGQSFVQAEPLPAGSGPVGIVATDVTRDGLVDLITLNAGSGNVSVNVASVGGGYGAPIRSASVGANPVALSLFNFNNDGIPDLVVVNAPPGGSGAITTMTGQGNGSFAIASTSPANGATSLAAGLLRSASEHDDLVTGGSSGLHLLVADGDGFGVVRLNVFTAISPAASLDRSGANDDLVLIDQNRGLLFIVLNVRAGGSPTIQAIDLNDLKAGLTPTSATTFRDAKTGLTNIAITAVGTTPNTGGFGQVIVLLNDGSGTFTDFGSFRQFVATPGATNLLAGDLNNDGADDLVFIDSLSNVAGVMLNDGANFFLGTTFRETGASVPVAARLADINDDDRLDLVVAHQGSGVEENQSVITTLLGDGAGGLTPSGPALQVPDFALSLVGGVANFETDNIPRIVDFNNDGFPDFAVATSRGGTNSLGAAVPSVTVLINRSDSPGNFTVQPPIALIDDSPAPAGTNLQLAGTLGGPGIVSGRNGDPATAAAGAGVGFGGAQHVLAVADFDADGAPDLVVTGTAPFALDANGDGLGDAGTPASGIPGVPAFVNQRAAIYLAGDPAQGTVRVARPLRVDPYAAGDPSIAGDGTFVAAAAGNFSALDNLVPDVAHVSINGSIWIDSNATAVANHAPIVRFSRSALNAPFGQGRKVIMTSGQTMTVHVTAADLDRDSLAFRLVPAPGGDQPPPFVSIDGHTGTITIQSADINRGPGVARFRIGVEASDAGSEGPGGRHPLTGRDFFTLVVNANHPPAIALIANINLIAGTAAAIILSVSDPDPDATITAAVECDRGNFATMNGTTLSLAPAAADVGTTTCTVTARDQFGLSSMIHFTVTVTAGNVAPTIAPLADVTVRAGEVRTLTVLASDAPGDPLRLSLIAAPAFVSLSDNGNGSGSIRIAPPVTETIGGPVTVEVRDRGGLTASASFNVTVLRRVQIGWNEPAAIIYGDRLGAAQLNATASVPGAFVYDPAAGTALPSGTHTLTGTFTPADVALAAVTTSTSIKVLKAPLIVTAQDQAALVFEALPWFTARYSGFVLGETTTVLSGSPTFATPATPSSPAGTYPILVSPGTLSASNYDFRFVNGTLTLLGPQQMLQGAASTARMLRDAAVHPADRRKLDEVFERLSAAADALNWLDATHLRPRTGTQTFDDAREAVVKLTQLLETNKSGIGASALQNLLDLIVKACRIVAVVSILEADAGQINPKRMEKARGALSRGDAAWQAKRYHGAIIQYGHAFEALLKK